LGHIDIVIEDDSKYSNMFQESIRWVSLLMRLCQAEEGDKEAQERLKGGLYKSVR